MPLYYRTNSEKATDQTPQPYIYLFTFLISMFFIFEIYKKA